MQGIINESIRQAPRGYMSSRRCSVEIPRFYGQSSGFYGQSSDLYGHSSNSSTRGRRSFASIVPVDSESVDVGFLPSDSESVPSPMVSQDVSETWNYVPTEINPPCYRTDPPASSDKQVVSTPTSITGTWDERTTCPSDWFTGNAIDLAPDSGLQLGADSALTGDAPTCSHFVALPTDVHVGDDCETENLGFCDDGLDVCLYHPFRLALVRCDETDRTFCSQDCHDAAVSRIRYSSADSHPNDQSYPATLLGPPYPRSRTRRSSTPAVSQMSSVVRALADSRDRACANRMEVPCILVPPSTAFARAQ